MRLTVPWKKVAVPSITAMSFVVKISMAVGLRFIVFDEIAIELPVFFGVQSEIHGHEHGQLAETWVDFAPAGEGGRHLVDGQFFQQSRIQFGGVLRANLDTLIRGSTGPAISVMLTGCAGSSSMDITAAAVSTQGQG